MVVLVTFSSVHWVHDRATDRVFGVVSMHRVHQIDVPLDSVVGYGRMTHSGTAGRTMAVDDES